MYQPLLYNCFHSNFFFQKPTCCNSGQLTTDACGCCPVCAKDQSEICGGPWGTSGTCASSKGLQCLKLCGSLTGNS